MKQRDVAAADAAKVLAAEVGCAPLTAHPSSIHSTQRLFQLPRLRATLPCVQPVFCVELALRLFYWTRLAKLYGVSETLCWQSRSWPGGHHPQCFGFR